MPVHGESLNRYKKASRRYLSGIVVQMGDINIRKADGALGGCGPAIFLSGGSPAIEVQSAAGRQFGVHEKGLE
jgi:hypothetical protein